MRLKSIKLAGFKSFVDPTTVPFPSNMTAIVGPNGCGKSNVIDAVRWVMGESSAKYLRGESMSDVIFNGSHARKPVGQASIELVFDNSDGTAPGEYGRFNEISVKRRVTREGQSEYFLNNARCRRRDITDLFLGTGLGPRSYAIIEQGMISRLIEAKPEELRIYIEEAAGISKYKERRRETENRMRRTLENLERLTDLRDELERQLQHLQRQATAAEKYKEFKQEEREKKAQLAALRWQNLDQQLKDKQSQLQDVELELERALTDRVNHESALENHRQEHIERTDSFNKAQGKYYEVGADIARVEQSLAHQKERAEQLVRELQQAQENRQELERDLEQDERRLEAVQEELAELEPSFEEYQVKAEESGEKLQDAEARMSDWQQRWEQFSQRAADDRQRAELAQSHAQNSEDALMRLSERKSRLEDEKALLEEQVDRSELEALQENRELAESRRDELIERLESLEEAILQERETLAEYEATVNDSREQIQTCKGELASHRAMLDEQLGDRDADLQAWLDQQGLAGQSRLAQVLSIANGWENALETVLGALAQAVTTDALGGLEEALGQGVPTGLAMVEAGAHGETAVTGTLAAHVSGSSALNDFLGQIRTADTLQEAMALRSSLKPGESVVTPQGTWMGRHWMRTSALGAEQIGVIERQRLVEELEQRLETHQARLEEAEAALEEKRQGIAEREERRDECRRALREEDQALSEINSSIRAFEARFEQIDARLERLRGDLAEIEDHWSEEEQRLTEHREVWQEALAAMEENAEQKEQLLAERDDVRGFLDDLRQRARHDRDQSHQLQLQVQSLRNQRDGLKDTLDRLQMQRERLAERVDMLLSSQEETEAPVEDLRMELEGLLERRLAEEERLTEAREALEEIDTRVREIEQARGEAERRAQTVRERIEKLRMEAQALEIRCDNHLQQLKELEVGLKGILENLPEEAEEGVWEQELEKLGNRIQRLGAINLAAIDEYRVQSERKTYLDEQHADLSEALETLENAIRKIDRETRQRFKETFDQVNRGLQELFPKVFGGGNAYLDLTGDDLLETGVAIMARPPGKKNSTIHLLSGGEKALTAIALVFSIFQLNPAPFCMLDEVDAPLDDANVGRYATLVKEMASQVQFIYITHNKIAMEMADQLMGVTMHEPGVSRLVSVDVEEAAALAEA
ncbi:chromosome segregation protein SMC [Marinobacteraceae bacterium S3BR75-40.1]